MSLGDSNRANEKRLLWSDLSSHVYTRESIIRTIRRRSLSEAELMEECLACQLAPGQLPLSGGRIKQRMLVVDMYP